VRLLATALLSALIAALAPPAFADTELGGYAASAEASIVRIGIYEPAIPIPAEPQVDASIGFARSTTANGPSSRGLASYLWPGDAVGDGLGVLLGNEALDYPVKTYSNFPATETGPAQNAVQINHGNGMSTSADGRTTRATVVGLGLGNGIGDPGSGLCQLYKRCTNEPPKIDLPDPIAAAATIENLKSRSTVVLGERSITATAHSVATGISILGGLITVDGLDMRSESRSDAATGSASGTSSITGLRVLGQKVDLGDPVTIGGKPSAPPRLPQVLDQLGIKIEYLEHQRSEKGPAGSLHAQGLTITLDVAPLRNLLRLGGLSDTLAPLFTNIDQLGPLLTGLLKLGTKIVITVGDVRTSVTASPAYVFPTGPIGPPAQGPVDSGQSFAPGAAPLPGVGPEPVPANVNPPLATVVPTSVDLPGLGRVPTWFVLAGLTLVGLLAWAIRGFGAWIFGGGSCVLGTSIGVPDLRKVRSP
jgi:hypothetical protein